MVGYVEMLYKFRHATDQAISTAVEDKAFFSSRWKLDDALYDMEVRIAKKITEADLRTLASIMRGRSYATRRWPQRKLLQAIEASNDPFERIGLLAEHADESDLLEQLRSRNLSNRHLQLMSLTIRLALKRFLASSIVLCLAESPSNKALWSTYAQGHKGFCLAYEVNARHPLAQRLRPVRYTDVRVPTSLESVIVDPVRVRDTMVFEKSLDWAWQKEWRVVTSGEPAALDPPLELREVIIGAAMDEAMRVKVRQAFEGKAKIRRARAAFLSGFDLSFVDEAAGTAA